MTSINLKILTSAYQRGKVFKARGINENCEMIDIIIFSSDHSKQQTDRINRGAFLKFIVYTLNTSPTMKILKLNSKSRVNIPLNLNKN